VIFLTSWGPVGVSRRTVLHPVLLFLKKTPQSKLFSFMERDTPWWDPIVLSRGLSLCLAPSRIGCSSELNYKEIQLASRLNGIPWRVFYGADISFWERRCGIFGRDIIYHGASLDSRPTCGHVLRYTALCDWTVFMAITANWERHAHGRAEFDAWYLEQKFFCTCAHRQYVKAPHK